MGFLCKEVVPISEGPLSEVPLYILCIKLPLTLSPLSLSPSPITLHTGEEEPLSEAQVPPVVGNQQRPSLHPPPPAVAGGAVRGGGGGGGVRVHSSPLPHLDEQLNTIYLSESTVRVWGEAEEWWQKPRQTPLVSNIQTMCINNS